jgi:hypothetical protein
MTAAGAGAIIGIGRTIGAGGLGRETVVGGFLGMPQEYAPLDAGNKVCRSGRIVLHAQSFPAPSFDPSPGRTRPRLRLRGILADLPENHGNVSGRALQTPPVIVYGHQQNERIGSRFRDEVPEESWPGVASSSSALRTIGSSGRQSLANKNMDSPKAQPYPV